MFIKILFQTMDVIQKHSDNIMSVVLKEAWSWRVTGTKMACTYFDGEHNSVSECLVILVFVAVLITYWYAFPTRKSMNHEKLPLPPGPRGLPLVGNLLSLENNLHIYLVKLAKVYGPIMKLQFGSKVCVVISSSSLAKEVLRDHDAIFANRDSPIAALISSYGGIDIAWSPNNPERRKLRKVFAHAMLSKKNLDSCYTLRREEVRKTVTDLYRHKIHTPINICEQVYITILNVIMGMLWGGTLEGEERSRVGAEFRDVIGEVIELIGKPNISDVFPVLRWFDIQGIERQTKTVFKWLDRIFDSVIEQRMKIDKEKKTETCENKESGKDFLQFLLELMEQGDPKTQITMSQLKALLMDTVVAGTDTTSTSIEWVMTEMMQHPEIMRKIQDELEKVVGMNNMVEESHLPKLHYLEAVVKETLRLHPPGPLLLPHSPISSCTVGGYTVPKGAIVFFNAWAIHRSPEEWSDPLNFQPERFLSDSKNYDYSGNNFNYLPFGSGRRMCAGVNLAERMLTYVLASLLHSFDWRLPEGTKLDLTEKFGIALKKSIPLVAIPTPRLLNLELYNWPQMK